VDRKLACDLTDLFRLKKDDLPGLEGFAVRSAAKLVDAIPKSQRVELGRLLYQERAAACPRAEEQTRLEKR
jgi:NAD-dependent DNA ligase